ncbi:MAG: N-acetylmuramoyl-L-alanine amidase, partial [Pseudomonadota bacterium]|nr:N-acetylmuramoyl-L-alanine amidase [Pseudomonadota bacterium]
MCPTSAGSKPGDRGGDLNIVEYPSPNHGPRRGAPAPNLIVLHYTAMETAQAALDRLCSEAAEVSCHYLIDEAGQVFRLVSEMRRAWHAGVAAWGPIDDVNSHSIGIELAQPGQGEGGGAAGAGPPPPFPEAQIAALERLLAAIRLRWGIPAARVLGHSDVAVGRKIDPGESFPWARLAAGGHAIWSEAETPEGMTAMLPPEASIAINAIKLGYRMPSGAEGWPDLLRALQMRYAPDETGAAASPRLAARVAELAERHPVATGERRSPVLPALRDPPPAEGGARRPRGVT